MPLPNASITPIPNNEPDAVPSLWNTRYVEIDENFADHESRLSARETEINNARGGKASLSARLSQMDSDIGSTSIDMQNARDAALKYALDQAALANYGVRALREQAQQQGEFTVINRGVVSGCAVSKSGTAARNLSLSAGVCFANGRAYSVADGTNAASVPSNTGSGSVTVYAYLYQDAGGLWRLAVTPIGSALPDGAIRIYNVTIPANSTDATDPNLTGVTLTDVRRIESQFPQLLNSPASVTSSIEVLSSNDYQLSFDVVSAVGAPCEAKCLAVSSRATNGFTVLLASAADSVVVRWKLSKLDN